MMKFNTRLISNDYNYVAPTSIDEALNILEGKKDVKVLAGGTDIIVQIKSGADIPMQTMMDIKRLPGLNHLDSNNGETKIGALTSLSTVENDKNVTEKYPALQEAIKAMAAIAVRNMGTIAGNLCNASPAADTACPCIIYDAKVKLVSLEGERIVPVREFFKGPGKSAKKENELMTEIILPEPKANIGAAFMKKTRVKADISKISVAILFEKDGDKIANAEIALGSVAATPLYLKDIANTMVGKKATKELFEEIGEKVADTIKPIDDSRSTAEYRKAIAPVLVADVMAIAWERAGGAV